MSHLNSLPSGCQRPDKQFLSAEALKATVKLEMFIERVNVSGRWALVIANFIMGLLVSWPVTLLVLRKGDQDRNILMERGSIESMGHWSTGYSGWDRKEEQRWPRTQSRERSQKTNNAC